MASTRRVRITSNSDSGMPITLTQSEHHDGFANAFLRGVSILAVVAIHTLANIPNIYSTTGSHWLLAVAIDQFCRFSVPLFVALSGFGFWQKYQKSEFHWWRFIRRQFSKLFWPYLLASGIFYLTFLLIPNWRSDSIPRSFVVQLLFGKADYHLYFVPMIFQLYLLFPLVKAVVRKLPWISLLIAAVFQVWLYQLYTLGQSQVVGEYLGSDQQQYFWFFSWIYYYVLGMHLPRILSKIEKCRWSLGGFFAIAAGAWWWATTSGIAKLSEGIDPIIALRFTHADILLYATFLIIGLFAAAELAGAHFRKNTVCMSWLGKYSYSIYLCHTLVLRVAFAL